MPELIDWSDRFVVDSLPALPGQPGACEWCRAPFAGSPRLFEVYEVVHDGEPMAVACSPGCARHLAQELTVQINRGRRVGFFA